MRIREFTASVAGWIAELWTDVAIALGGSQINAEPLNDLPACDGTSEDPKPLESLSER